MDGGWVCVHFHFHSYAHNLNLSHNDDVLLSTGYGNDNVFLFVFCSLFCLGPPMLFAEILCLVLCFEEVNRGTRVCRP